MRTACAAGCLLFLACSPVHVSARSPEVFRVGRFDDTDPAGPKFIWSASRFSLRFQGESVRVRLKQTTRPQSVEAGPQPLRMRVELDGSAREIYADEQNVLSFHAEVPAGLHRLTLVRQSEALIGEGQLLDVELSPGSKVLPWDQQGRPLIEFIGDSVTVGFGNEGVAPCRFSSQAQAITSAYPWMVGEALHADVRVVGWSGHGVTRNWGDRPEPVVPEQWSPAAPAPDFVFVALGANDFWNGDPGPERFVPAYAAFIGRVRAAYPRAEVYAVITPTGTAQRRSVMREYLSQSGAPVLEMGEMPESDGRGCIGHPNAKSQRRAADDVIARLCADSKDLCAGQP